MLQWHITNLTTPDGRGLAGEIILRQSELDFFHLEYQPFNGECKVGLMIFNGYDYLQVLRQVRKINWDKTHLVFDLKTHAIQSLLH